MTACHAAQIVPKIEGALERVHVCVKDRGPHSDDPSPPEPEFLTPANLTAGHPSASSACQSGRQGGQAGHTNDLSKSCKSLQKTTLCSFNGLSPAGPHGTQFAFEDP